MAEFEPLPAEWYDPANREAVARLLAPPHVVVEIHDELSAAELERLRDAFRAVPDGATLVVDIDSPAADWREGLELMEMTTQLAKRRIEVGCLIRGHCPGPLSWAVLGRPVTGVMPAATVQGMGFDGDLCHFVDASLRVKRGASRRMVSRLSRDHTATAEELIRGGLAFPSGESGLVAVMAIKELEARLNRGEV